MRAVRLRSLVALTLAVATPLVLPDGAIAGGGEAAGTAACYVRNVSDGAVGRDLQAMIDAADPGDVLRVKGTCTGNFSIAQDIVLVGPAVLDGETCSDGYCGRGVVLYVSDGVRATLANLTITGGYATAYGGGIMNWGTLELRGNTSVTGNWAEDAGGGIYNEGTLVMYYRASVTDNYLLFGQGGGVWNVGTMVMKGWSTVAANSGTFGGGVYNEGRLWMVDHASVAGNTAETAGGIWNTGRLVMKGSSSVTANTATGGVGGGVVDDGTMVFGTAWTGTVCGNTPDDWPGCTR